MSKSAAPDLRRSAFVGLLWAAWAIASGPAHAQGPAPRAVPELTRSDGIATIAVWTPDDRYVITGSGGQVVIWESATGNLIDRIDLPEIPGATINRLVSMDLDGRALRVRAVINAGREPRDGGGSRTIWKLAAFEMDLDARRPEVRILPEAPGRAEAPMVGRNARYDWNRLPASHDGRRRLMLAVVSASTNEFGPTAADEKVVVTDADGHAPVSLQTLFRPTAGVAIPSPDGQRLLLDVGGAASVVDRLSSREIARLNADLSWEAATWFGNDHVSAYAVDFAEGTAEQAQVFNATTGAASKPMADSLAPLVALAPGVFLGSKIYPRDPSERGVLQRFDARGSKRFGPVELQERDVYSLALSPDRRTVIVSFNPTLNADQTDFAADDGITVALDAVSGRRLGDFRTRHAEVKFEPDGRRLLARDQAGDVLWVWTPGPEAPRRLATGVGGQFEWNGRTVVISEPGRLRRLDVATGLQTGTMMFPNVAAMGFLDAGRVFWASSPTAGVRYWSAEGDWPELFTTRYIVGPDRSLHHFTTAPDGRYDSDLGPDTRAFHWIMPDDPWTPLAPQTFMRDYYEPRLGARLTACALARSCRTAFPPVRPIVGLERSLPRVQVTSVRMGATAALVDVEARAGRPSAPGEPEAGAVYDLRLFRDGKLVGQFPGAATSTGEAGIWRDQNRIRPDADGVVRRRFQVPLPTGPAGVLKVTAYAFNADRVKSETAVWTGPRPDSVPRTRRAFVLAIGENHYPRNTAWNLNFAATDARRMAKGLRAIPGFEVTALTLLSDGETTQGTKSAIRDALALIANPMLGGQPLDRAAALARLRAAGVAEAALAGLQTATPDDVVILSFSGHGWVDKGGGFFLLPSDAEAEPGSGAPRPATLISSAELTDWMRDIDAGEVAVIIDACHSAASIETHGFKPGPFGDAGLGQLAFDKGLRLLAGAQADAVAMEDASLGQGLLTYALVREGLNDEPAPGVSGRSFVGAISLDAWLRAAAARLPVLSQMIAEQRMTPGARGQAIVFTPLSGGPGRPAAQEPTLFDFTGAPSRVVLRPTSSGARR